PVKVEPGDDAGRLEPGLDELHRRQVLARVAYEYGVVRHLPRRRQETRGRAGPCRGSVRLAARLPALMELLDEAFGAHVDARAHAHLLQKGHEPVILAR